MPTPRSPVRCTNLTFSQQVADGMEKILECPVCLDAFQASQECRRPHCLPCGHSLCCECLDGMLRISRSRRSCPACRYPLKADQVARYPRNFALEQVVFHLEQAKQGASATRSAASGVAAKENTNDVAQVKGFAVGDMLRAWVSSCRSRFRPKPIHSAYTHNLQASDLLQHPWLSAITGCTKGILVAPWPAAFEADPEAGAAQRDQEELLHLLLLNQGFRRRLQFQS
ncbi:TPA: tripartite motif containing 71, E3 ubiquitin protein ligase [Trebouxia sp. C0005]